MILDVLRTCVPGASLPTIRDACGLNSHMAAQLVVELIDAGYLSQPETLVPCCKSGMDAPYRITESGRSFLERMDALGG